MAFARVGLSLLLLVTLCVLQGNGLSCHQCSPNDNLDCMSVKTDSVSLTCDLQQANRAYQMLLHAQPPNYGNRFVCLKTISTGGGRTAALHTCFPGVDHVCEKFRQLLGPSLQYCDTCESDGCNGAHSPVILSYVTLSIISIFVALYNIL